MDNVISEIETKLHEANLQMQRTFQSLSAFSTMDLPSANSIISAVTRALREVRQTGLIPNSTLHERKPSQEEALYWDSLKKLEKALPALHIQLRIRRANLEHSFSHRQTVARWVEVNKELF